MSKDIKIKWKVSDRPEGRWASFQKRGWPMAFYENEDCCAYLLCEDEYIPHKVKLGAHKPLQVLIADYKLNHDKEGRMKWRKVKKSCASLQEAKQVVAEIIKKYPELHYLKF